MLSPESFLKTLKQSRLLTKTQWGVVQSTIRGAVESPNAAPLRTSIELARDLVTHGLLTTWQAEKLLDGKHKGFFLGKYRLLRPLGVGGMCFVYLAEHSWLQQTRAIKILPQSKQNQGSHLERFYREAQAAAKLDHPNIVKTFDIAEQGRQHYIVMEYVDGVDLATVVRHRGRLPIGEAVEYLKQSATALLHAHSADLIHRDIKPGNFLLTRHGQIKLMDLGLAKFMDQPSELTVVHNDTLMGTADFLSPEQALHSHLVDHRTDLYSLGATFYFLIAGHPPFPDGTVAQRLARHQALEPPGLEIVRSDCPPTIAALCRWMLEKSPEDRPADCGTVVHWLEQWQRSPDTRLPSEFSGGRRESPPHTSRFHLSEPLIESRYNGRPHSRSGVLTIGTQVSELPASITTERPLQPTDLTPVERTTPFSALSGHDRKVAEKRRQTRRSPLKLRSHASRRHRIRHALIWLAGLTVLLTAAVVSLVLALQNLSL